MSFLRCRALRASSLARSTRAVRSAQRQPWQRAVQRRTYASGHGAHGESQGSEIPWIVGALAGTGGGLYFVLNQDLGHHAAHDKKDHADTHANHEGQDDSGDDDAQDKPADEGDDEQSEEAGKPDKNESDGAPGDEPDEASSDNSDKPDPRGKPKSFNETAGKQEGLSNADTHHSSQISKQDDKSKKGEGVAETAKLKGTVSPDRPGAENKEERGKAQLDKDA